jgi:hypothetical protein
VQEIADWLENLGMAEYAERFAENKIDISVLRHLTDQDLKDIGAGCPLVRLVTSSVCDVLALFSLEFNQMVEGSVCIGLRASCRVCARPAKWRA